jgi:hypothetical protein
VPHTPPLALLSPSLYGRWKCRSERKYRLQHITSNNLNPKGKPQTHDLALASFLEGTPSFPTNPTKIPHKVSTLPLLCSGINFFGPESSYSRILSCAAEPWHLHLQAGKGDNPQKWLKMNARCLSSKTKGSVVKVWQS